MNRPISEAILLHIPDAAILLDRQGRIIHANPRAEELFGYDGCSLTGQSLDVLLPEEWRAGHPDPLRHFTLTTATRPQGSDLPLFGQRRNGALFPANITMGHVGDGDDPTILVTVRDMTGQKRAEEELHQTNRALRLLSASNRTLLRCTDETELLSQVCRIAVEVGGYHMAWVGFAEHDEEMSVRPVAHFGYEEGFLAAARMSWADVERGKSAMSTAIRTGETQLRLDILNNPQLAPWHEDARRRNYQSAIALPLRVRDEVIGAIAIYAPEPDAFLQGEGELLAELSDDLSFGLETLRLRAAHEQAQLHLHQLAYFDSLTGLSNRISFTDHLAGVLAEAGKQEVQVALLLLDLEHLREINETHGHATGDRILVKVARQLQILCAPDCHVARFGGDDFTIICNDVDQEAAAERANRILGAIRQPVIIDDLSFSIGGSIGIAFFPHDSDSAQGLLSQADLAMTRAKDAGGGYRFFRLEMVLELTRKLELARHLKRAMSEGQLQLYYQPKVDLGSGRTIGAEALLRWNDPQLGWVSPAEFIPVAEERGLMVELGAWVLHSACRQIREWQDVGMSCNGRIAVNISSRQLDDPNFLALVSRIVEETGVSPDCLELELTESALMSDPEQVIGILTVLKQMGFGLAIDDFGTGYSSLVYLKRFPVDTLKIDQAFVRNMLVDLNDRAIISTIIAMAQQFGLTSVAEGVEQEAQLQALQQIGCMLAQGFHFSHAVPAEEFSLWLRENDLTPKVEPL